MIKTVAVVLILALWASYAAQGARKPVPAWYHPAINLMYLALTAAVIAWL